jgi:hypothetical protein
VSGIRSHTQGQGKHAGVTGSNGSAAYGYVMKEFYSSPNGDRWLLCRDVHDGSLFVRHEANAASGGYTSDIEIGDFLVRSPRHPEHDALLRLIGTLIEGSVEPS